MTIGNLADRVLSLFVPNVSARAGDCGYEYWCDRDQFGSVLYRRTCCQTSAGYLCGNWVAECIQCC
ncbi:hypothetical protein SAMN05444920_104309 [Nonomuraea solani]|uniref:Uncharacterized protein n=1 Tax=Nonomuraea solani TaxID=1144553 RepID=A0A1H6CSH0_9ACTN|nr:hypothetical protein [Nonomuraea solani]SEG75603.1 hypothetical protein SAMN05444920_104309 [Nonomuraea solani]